MVVDFGMLPPEVNSNRMYIGPGPGPLLTAAAAWDDLATELYSEAGSYSRVVSGLTAAWRGAASVTMASAAVAYLAWISATAGQAERTAVQARAAAAAYETAFAATVPPSAVAANRARLLALIATNFFGQNMATIAATQAEYVEMWAQDSAAMYGYAGSSAVASQVVQFQSPPQTVDPAGTAGQAAAVSNAAGTASAQTSQLTQLMSAIPAALQGLASPGSAVADPSAPASLASALNTILGFGTGPVSPLSYFSIAGVPQLLGAQSYLVPQAGVNLAGAVAKVPPAGFAGWSGGGAPVRFMGGSSISVDLGRSGLIGGLSVPQGWAVAAPEIRSAVAVAVGTGPPPAAVITPQGGGTMFGSMALSSIAGRAAAAGGSSAGGPAGGPVGAAAGEASGPVNIFIVPAGAQ